MGVIYHMSSQQYKNVCSMIRNLCCNYDGSTGGCPLLDRGEVVKCPQMISTSLICKYCRDVLLEDPDSKELKASIIGTECHKVCVVCGAHFRAVSNRAKYCARCSKKMERERKAEWARKSRSV